MVKITIYYNHEKKNYFLKILDMVEKSFLMLFFVLMGVCPNTLALIMPYFILLLIKV